MGADSVEELRGDRDTHVGQVGEELTGHAQTLVDLEGAVDVGVVDQTFPADSRTGFLDNTFSLASVQISFK